MPLPEFKEGEEAEFLAMQEDGQYRYMTHGKKYILYTVGEDYVVVRNNKSQWELLLKSLFAKPPQITDMGAAEYEEIMASIGETSC